MSTLPALARTLRRTSWLGFWGRWGWVDLRLRITCARDHMCEQEMDGWWDGAPTIGRSELIRKSMLIFLPCRQNWLRCLGDALCGWEMLKLLGCAEIVVLR
jgi:hypothetical protein